MIKEILRKKDWSLVPSRDIVVSEGLAEALFLSKVFNDNNQSILIIKNNLYTAQRLYSNLLSLVPENSLYLFPCDESLRINAVASSPEFLVERLRTLSALTEQRKIIITHPIALVRFLPDKNIFTQSTIKLEKAGELVRDNLVKSLNTSGYTKVSKVEMPLQFSVRGDIVDCYPVNHLYPLRIELAYDQIESIRYFDVETQKTIKEIKEALIPPASDLLFTENEIEEAEFKIRNFLDNNKRYLNNQVLDIYEETIETDIIQLTTKSFSNQIYQYYPVISEKTATLLDYFKGTIVVSNREAMYSNYDLFMKESFDYYQELIKFGKAIPNLCLHYDIAALNLSKAYEIKNFSNNANDLVIKTRSIPAFKGLTEHTAGIIKEYAKTGKILIALVEKHQKDALIEFFKHHNLNQATIEIIENDLKEGLELVEEKVFIFTKKELFNIDFTSNNFGRYHKTSSLISYDQLEVGDYVVHDQFGIGRFINIETMTIDGNTRDYIKIDYAGEDKLLVPLESFGQIRKFLSKEGHVPKLNRLSGSEWQRTKARIKNRVNDLADKLVALYSLRSEKQGYAFLPDDELQKEFENQFPFLMTKDQEKSLMEIKQDMQKPYPMDRLLCGDVGFGKTEIAFRAAFKAILSGKQVLLLCPTTFLARQHYLVAKERFTNYIEGIEMLSRFSIQQKAAIERIKCGKSQLIVATHRGLSEEITYPNLGLVIVDEEQRFGVKQKEKLKLLKNNIDVLTLTATPIPRTLQFSLIGVRGFSQIETPPENRLPVQTYVLEKSDFLVKEIISRELSRGGQVFYLHNNIADLVSIANKLSKELPQSKIAIAHGKMDKEHVESVLSKFYENEIDILISTTIIESGLDIPNANTIIVDDADRFGLSQLYQIRGRVGRSSRLSYCYLFYRPQKVLTDEAKKRLEAIKEFTELGSGYKIALRDLAIRGAGDMLGIEQSGFIDTVGMDLYIRLLKEAIDERQGHQVVVEKETTKIGMDAYIPDEYAGSLSNKFELYRKIISAQSIIEIDILAEEIKDLHGKNQKLPFLQLLGKRKLDILLGKEYIKDTKDFKNYIEIILAPEISSFRMLEQLEAMLENENIEIPLRFNDGSIRARISKDQTLWIENAVVFLLMIEKNI